MMGYGVCQRGRHPNGRKRRWTRAQKSAVKRARVEEWLSIARQWKDQKEEETGEDRSTTPTWGGVGKWVEELPWELWELVFDSLDAMDRLVCITSTKAMMENMGRGRNWSRCMRRPEMRCRRLERNVMPNA